MSVAFERVRQLAPQGAAIFPSVLQEPYFLVFPEETGPPILFRVSSARDL
jgi:hypothetical protein